MEAPKSYATVTAKYRPLFEKPGQENPVSIEDGVQNLRTAADSLEKLIALAPSGKSSLVPGNHESRMITRTELNTISDLRYPKAVLEHYFTLPEDQQPIWLELDVPDIYNETMEAFLNTHGKTLMPDKAKVGRIIRMTTDKYGNTIRELKDEHLNESPLSEGSIETG
ncbi:MAG: hypothetical protein ABIH34_04075 [Nanoarchaeota archaeon]